jgi:MoaA/NifB/PqqE/SkfB family radical SAM enzyme
VAKGEFSRIMANMSEFKKIGGLCRLGVSFIVDDRNAGHVYEMIMKVRDTGADSIKVSPCIVDNDGAKNNDFHGRYFKTVKKQIARALTETDGEDFEIFDAYHALDEKFDKDYSWCPYCQILPVIGADLNIYSCQDKAYNLENGLLGDIAGQRFKKFWFSSKNKFFSLNPAADCGHHCVANGKNKLVLAYLAANGEHLGFV